jgi:4-amino-4-deoxy-L-arabinose transferase-like glycosyltransferase
MPPPAANNAGLADAKSIYPKLGWILLLAILVRVGVRLCYGSLNYWENGYTFFFALAENIAAGRGLAFDGGPPTAFRVPLYPAFLAAITFGHKAFIQVVIAQSLIGAGTVWCAAVLTREWFGNTAAIIAAAFTAVYPYYVVHDTALQETSLYTFLGALAVFLMVRVRRKGSFIAAAGAGLSLAGAVLTRANLLPFAIYAPLWLVLVGGKGAMPWARRWLVAFVCVSTFALCVTPWLIRSYKLTGAFTFTTQSGFFLWLGNNALTFSHYPSESIDRSQATALAALTIDDKRELESRRHNEVKADEWFRQKGFAYIYEHPWQTMKNDVRKVVDAFGWLPSPRNGFWQNLVHALSYGPIMVYGFWGMWRFRSNWREHAIVYGQFFGFIAVTAIFFGHTSYRSYLDVYLIVFSAGLLAAWRVNEKSMGQKPPDR